MKRFILPCIIFIAFVFRFYNLTNVPPSPSLDEVSIGYNAYSILKTGKDEYGNAFPVLLRAYDDFRPALYVYLTIPFVWLFGLNALAVRLPSALLSVFVVFIMYRIGVVIGKKYVHNAPIGEIASSILAISPWHLYLSRLGHEANLGLALVVFGIYFFLKKSWGWSAVIFGLSLHSYQSEKVVAPLLVFFGCILFAGELWKEKKQVIIAALVGLVIALPAVIVTLSPEGLARFRGTSTLPDNAPKIAIVTTFAKNYVSHFSPGWLFAGTEREAHKVPGMGLMYLWEAPLLFLGIWASHKLPRKLVSFFLTWIFVSLVPAAITTQAPHAMRSFTVIPALAMVEAMGVWFIMKQRVAVFFAGAAAILGLFQFWNGYFVRFPVEQSDSFQYAIQPAIRYALANENLYKRVEFSHQGALYQSYMFYLFYSRFDPRRYLSLGGTESGGYEATHYIGKYAFGFIPEKSGELKPGILYFYDVTRVPKGLTKLQTFYNLDGTPAIVAGTL